MPDESNKPTREALNGYGMRAERHWRAMRPKLVAALLAEGGEALLLEHLLEAQECAEELVQSLLRQGHDLATANEIADHEYLLLPDITTG